MDIRDNGKTITDVDEIKMENGLLLVIGANGLLGSAAAVAGKKAGYRVRGLVRSRSDLQTLEDAGVEAVVGDVTDPQSLERAMEGVRDVLNASALIGGTWSTATPEEHWAVNYQGQVNILDAAQKMGVRRTVLYSSGAILDWSFPHSHTTPIQPRSPNDSPYAVAKRAAYYASMHRAAMGQDTLTVFPGAIYGPSLFVERAIVPTSFTGTLLSALKGELKQYVGYPMPFTTAEQCAAVGIAALEKGRSGVQYQALCRDEDVCNLPDFCNLGCEIAGVSHRVKNVDVSVGGKDVGSAMKNYAERDRFRVDTSATERELGVYATSLTDGLRETIDWLRAVGKLD